MGAKNPQDRWITPERTLDSASLMEAVAADRAAIRLYRSVGFSLSSEMKVTVVQAV